MHVAPRPEEERVPEERAGETDRAPAPVPAPRREEPTLPDLVRMVLDERWLVVAVAGAVLALASVYLFVATPLFESNVVIQVQSSSQTLPGLEDLSSVFSEKTPAETEIEIIRSRSLVGSVVDRLGLAVEARPRRFPVIGAALARRYDGRSPADAWPGFSAFAWGGERIRVGDLSVSDDLLGQPLLLTALEGGRFRLASPDGADLLEGAVGATARRAEEPLVEILVSELAARPGTTFWVAKRHRSDVVDLLRVQLRAEETGKKTGILVLTLEGADPVRVAAILNGLAETYLRHHVERKSADAAKTLDFLDAQLPVLKAGLEKAESALNEFQRRRGTVNLSQETVAMLGRAVEVEKALSELKLQQAELRQRFTENHPMLASVAQKADRLRAERAAVTARMRELPETELDSARLTRDVTVASELYVLLLNKAQELRIVKSGVVGNVTILDEALVPRRPSRPRTGMVLALALMLGVGGGVATALGRRTFRDGAEDPEDVETGTGLPVFVTIPHSAAEDGLERASRREAGHHRQALAEAAPDDVAVEHLRSLRTALQFALVEARNNVIALAAPAPGTGKTFVSANLAHLLASSDRRVLLVDGDLRRGRIHRFFGTDRQPGLSDVLSGSATPEAAVRPTPNASLHFVPTGRIPPNPAELLASQRFQQFLAAMSKRYDLVIVDTPPVLAVTDPALIARCAGVNLMVLRAGHHSVREIVLTVKNLARSGVRIQGAILNDLRATGGRYGRYGRYYRYEYRSERR